MAIFERLRQMVHAWNAFVDNERTRAQQASYVPIAVSYGSSRPDRTRLRTSNERSILASILTRLSIDTSSVDILHVRLDEEGRYQERMISGLNECLTVEANIDQAARHFRQDILMTLFEHGVAAIVPVDTTIDPAVSGSFDIKTLRVGWITAWQQYKVCVCLYNEAKGLREEIWLDKKFVAIVENPLYAVMNEPNSTLRRLIHKLNLLDAVDEQSSSGKLDILIQLPYTVRSEARKKQARERREEIENQLKGSKYGIAYVDGTEKVTQLNRPAENNLLKQVEFLTEMLYAQLGLTAEVMNGTADEKTMLNYINRTIEPLITAIVEAMRRTFLTKTARAQRQSIVFFRDPFKLVPISELAEISDKFTRNKIATSNEIRGVIGWKPSKDPSADKLENANMPGSEAPTGDDPAVQSALDSLDRTMDGIFQDLGVDENAVS